MISKATGAHRVSILVLALLFVSVVVVVRNVEGAAP